MINHNNETATAGAALSSLSNQIFGNGTTPGSAGL
jgi:hypothetical protein